MTSQSQTTSPMHAALKRGSGMASSACVLSMLIVEIYPRYAFGMSDDLTAAILEAILSFAILLGLLNSVAAIIAFYFVKELRRSIVLMIAIVLAPLILVFAPAIQTA